MRERQQDRYIYSGVAMNDHRTTAAILAGGRGTRFGGQAKGALLVGGRPILERQLEVLRPLFDRIVVVSNDQGPWTSLGLRVVTDRYPPGAGPLAGVDAALAALHPNDSGIVCVGCDMPFLHPGALTLIRDARDAPAVVPRVNGRAEPLLARYGRSAAPVIEQALAAGERSLHRVLEKLPTRWVSEAELRAVASDLTCLVNVNTPEALAQADQEARRREG